MRSGFNLKVLLRCLEFKVVPRQDKDNPNTAPRPEPSLWTPCQRLKTPIRKLFALTGRLHHLATEQRQEDARIEKLGGVICDSSWRRCWAELSESNLL